MATQKHQMEYRKLGPSGLAVSRLALGTMYFGGETPEDDAFAILDTFIEAGGNLVDTSNVYSGGKSEEIIGRWFASRPKDVTDRVVLATKGRFSTDPDVNGSGTSRRQLSRSLEGSLERLRRETVDLYQMHAWDPLTPVEETLKFLDDAVKAGKAHYIGLSNFTGWQLELAVSTALHLGLHVPVSLQQQYSLLSRESEWEVVPACRHNGLGILPWSPLAGGFLTGKYERGGKPPANTRAGSEKSLYQWTSSEYAASDRNWATIAEVIRIAKQIGATPSQVALAWLADKPGVAAPIVGARTAKQLHETLGAATLHLDPDAMRSLDEVSKPQSGTYPYGDFGVGQRARSLEPSGTAGVPPVTTKGSDAPLGHK